MRLPRLFREGSAGEKEQVYNLAAAIERESGHRLTATPGEDGIAVSDGRALHFVQPTEIDSPEALRLHLKFWLTGKLEPIEAVKTPERLLESEGARPFRSQAANVPAISQGEEKTVRAAELTLDAVAGAQPKSSQDIGSKKGPLDITSAKRTLEQNSGDLQGPGRKTTETELTEKTHSESEGQKLPPQARQAHIPPRYLVKETLKELEHEL